MQPELQTSAAPQTTARDFLAVLFRRGPLILTLFLVTTLTVLVIAFTTPVEYVSSGRVLVKRGEKESALTPSRRVYNDWEEDMGSEVEVVKSAAVLERARTILNAEAGAGRSAPQVNPKAVDVEVKGRTNVILVGYVDRDPVVAKQVCDALVRAYYEFRLNDFSSTVPRGFFEGELTQVQTELDHWVTLRRNYASQANVLDLPMQRTADIGRMSGLKGRLNEIDADLADAKTGLAKLSELHGTENIDQPAFTALFSEETALIELKRRVVDQEYKMATLKEKMRDDAPEVEAAAVTLDTLRAMLRREIFSRVSAAQARVDVLTARRAAVQRDIDELQGTFATLPEKERAVAEMDRRIDMLKQRYRDLSESSSKARINENTTPNQNVVLLARASNGVPRNARDYVRLALAPAFSLVVGIGIAFFLDGLDLTVRTAHHAEEAVDVPVLATLSERRRRRGEVLVPERAAS